MANQAVNDALAAAEAQASTAALPAVVAQGSTAVAPVLPGRKLTANDQVGSSMNVDLFIKFNELGTILLGTEPKQHESLKLMLDLSEIAIGYGIRYGNPPVYGKTFDGVTTTKGGLWADEVAKAQRIDPRSQPYNSWDLTFTLLEDAGAAKAGSKLGYSTVWSSYKEFRPFYDKVVKQFGENAVIELELSCKGVNQPGKKYGFPVFTLIGEVTGE